MQRQKYHRSKIPLWLVLLYLLNMLLIIGMEVLILYPHPFQPSMEELSAMEPACENARLVSVDESSHLRSVLTQTPEGNYWLVVLKKHGLFYGRAKLQYSEPVSPPPQGETEITVRTGIRNSQLILDAAADVTIRFDAAGGQNTATIYMALSALLEGLELVLWHLIRQEAQ